MPDDTATFDPRRRFVRIVEQRADGMVEFEFAVGEPQLFVEMLLPRAAFDSFCTAQQVTPTDGALPPAPGHADPGDGIDWTLHAAMAQVARAAQGGAGPAAAADDPISPSSPATPH